MGLTTNDTLALKGIAICLMLFHHQFLTAVGYGGLTYSFAAVSKCCVSVFLFVSGYGLACQWSALQSRVESPTKPAFWIRRMISFLLKRFSKFYFLYWFCFAVVLIAGILCGRGLADAYPDRLSPVKCLMLDFFGLMGYNSYLPEWWFNKMILQLYLLFPLFCLLLHSRVGTLLTLLAAVSLVQWTPVHLFCIEEGGLLVFLCGMALARKPIAFSRKGNLWAAAVAVVLLVPLSLFRLNQSLLVSNAVIDTLMTLCLVLVWKGLSSFSKGRVTRWLGVHSSVTYLTHSLLLIILPWLCYPLPANVPMSVPVNYLAFLLLATLVSWLLTMSREWIGFNKLRDNVLLLIGKI